jgi:hypothetical protein
MVALTKTFAGAKKMIGIAALVAAGIVAADDFATARSASPAEVVKQVDRHPAMGGEQTAGLAEPTLAGIQAPRSNATAKTDRLAGDAGRSCDEQTWPRIAPECLLSAKASPKKPIRTVTVERQTSMNSSRLERSIVSKE